MLARIALLVLCVTSSGSAMAAACRWQEPPRSFAAGAAWSCAAIRWADGDTLTATCLGVGEPVRIRLRGVDTVERGDPRWRASRLQLRSRTEDAELLVIPHHMSHDRVVADVLAGGRNVGRAMHAAGWSKPDCPRL